MTTKSSLPEALRSLVRQKQLRLDSHPTPEELIAYYESRLPEEDDERIRDHLAVCGECVRDILDIDSFPEPQTRSGLPKKPRSLTADGRDRPGKPGHWWATAALAISLVVVSILALFLFSQIQDLRQPNATLHIVQLIPEEETQRSRQAERLETIPHGSGGLLLILTLADMRPFPGFSVEILNVGESGTDEVVWSATEVTRSPKGFFALELPERFLDEGGYRIHLEGVGGGRSERLAVYKLRIRYDTPTGESSR